MARVVAQVKSELNSWLTSLGAGEVSRDFFELIKAIGEARSKQEEHAIIDQESKLIRVQIKQGNAVTQDDPRLIRELLVRLMYCEMLGIQVPFGYMIALNLMQMRARLIDKRVGYLAASLFLHPDHELVTLCINSWRRDLQSQSHVEQDMALTAMAQLLAPEGIPAVLPEVLKCAQHLEPTVRKKSVVVLHRILQLEPAHAVEPDVIDTLRRTLCDPDPSVMATTLTAYATLARQAKESGDDAQIAVYRDVVPSLVSILKQVIEHALSRDFDYQRVPAPWLQVRLLSLLGYLGAGVRSVSEHAYAIVLETLRRAEQLPVNAARAIQYSAVTCIAQLYPNSALLDAAALTVTALLADKDRNVRYLGLRALLALVHVNPEYALQHQRAVIECLSDPDETLQRVTLKLLHAMANPDNVAVVAEQFLEHLKKTSDEYVRKDLVASLTSIAEQFAPDNTWFISTLVKVFVLGGSLVSPDVAYNLLVLIAEGSTGGEDEETDMALRRDAVQQLLRIAQKPHVQARAAILTQVTAWLLGEYAYVTHSETEAADALVDMLDRPLADEHVRVWIITALAKLTAQLGAPSPAVREALDKYSHSHNVELQQRACEVKALLAEPNAESLLHTLLPVDSSTQDLEVDPQLSFVDEWMRAQVAAGAVPARPYQPQRDSVLAKARLNSATAPKRALNYVYKEVPVIPTQKMPESIYESELSSGTQEVSSSLSFSGASTWGSGGWANASTLPSTALQKQLPTEPKTVTTSIPLSKPLAQQPVQQTHQPAPSAPAPPQHMSSADERLAQQLFGSVAPGAPRFIPPRVPLVSAARAPHRPAPQQQVAPPAQPEVNLLDLDFGAPSVPIESAPSLLEPMPAPLALAEDGAFPQVHGGENYDASNLRLPTPLQSLLSSSSSLRVLASSPELYIHSRVCFTPDSAILLVLISNKSDSGVVDLTLTITNHSAVVLAPLDSQNPLAKVTRHASTQITPQGTSLRLTTRSIPSRTTTATLFTVRAREPVTPGQLSITTAGSFSLTGDDLRMLHVRGTCTLSALDWVRPRVLDLATYGKQWPLHSREIKLSMTVPVPNAEELSKWLPANWHAHVVSLKGSEIVASATVLHEHLSPEQSSVLLYVKILSPGQTSGLNVALSVRAMDARVVEEVAQAIRNRM